VADEARTRPEPPGPPPDRPRHRLSTRRDRAAGGRGGRDPNARTGHLTVTGPSPGTADAAPAEHPTGDGAQVSDGERGASSDPGPISGAQLELMPGSDLGSSPRIQPRPERVDSGISFRTRLTIAL